TACSQALPDARPTSDVRPRFFLATLALAVPLVAAAAGTASPPTVAEKQSEAARVLAEIGRIDRQLSHTVDAYDGARVQLAALDGELRQAQLERERRTQRQTVARLAATRARIQSSLARRRELLASIHTEIVQIRARERARERRLAAEARARLRREHLLALAAQRERERARAQARA